MAKKSLGEIVRQSVAIGAFMGITIVLAGSMTGNEHWFHGTYRTKTLN